MPIQSFIYFFVLFCFLFIFVCLLCFYGFFYLFLSWVTQSFMQIHDFSIAFTEMVIQSVWLFISIVFSLLKLPITYLPAIECNILSLQSKENPSWLFKCLRLYILYNICCIARDKMLTKMMLPMLKLDTNYGFHELLLN